MFFNSLSNTSPWRNKWQLSLSLLACVFLFLVLVLPNRLSWITPLSLLYFPLELLLLGLLLMLPRRLGLFMRALATLVLGVGLLVKLADMGCYQIYARPFNPIFDAYLLGNGVQLLQGTLGRLGAYAVVVLLLAAVCVIFWVVCGALGRVQQLVQYRPRAAGAGLTVALLLWGLLSWTGVPRMSTYFYDLMSMHLVSTLKSMTELSRFTLLLEQDPYRDVPSERFFSKLQGKDVLLVFIESYGRTLLDKPEFATQGTAALRQANRTLAASGLQSRSGFLRSPTMGGLSWLAHGTVASGLWIDSQVRYDGLIMSQRLSFNALFKRAGWRSVALKPAHTIPWPEGAYFGYDQVYAAKDLGYAGQAFNWVTMPDQYVLSAFERLERQPYHTPVFGELALISSHAPWTPIPHLVDWTMVGDGRIFNDQASSGASPEEVWKDPACIRAQYALSVEYALANIASYAATYGDDNLVILVLGDHQPAPIVTGETDNRDVPIHLIARDPAIIDAIADWRWTEGMLPAVDAPVWPMSELRDHFIRAFSDEGLWPAPILTAVSNSSTHTSKVERQVDPHAQ